MRFFFLSLSYVIPFFNLFGDNSTASRENSVSREKPRHIPTIARPYVRLKLKTSIRRERGERRIREGEEEKQRRKNGRQKKRRRGKGKKRNRDIFSRASLHFALIITAFSLPSLLQVGETARNDERGGAQEFSVRAFLLASKTLLDRSESLRLKSKFNWRRGETKREKKKEEKKVKSGCRRRRRQVDRYEKVETIEINRGDKGETKLKQKKNKSTVLCSLSLTSALKKEDYYIIPYILYNIYHVTAVHLPSNHSHRDNRSKKTKDIHISKNKKNNNREKKIYGHAYSISISHLIVSVVDRKKRKEKEKHLKRRAKRSHHFPPHLFGRFFGLVSWTKIDQRDILSFPCVWCFFFVSSMFYYIHRLRIPLTVFTARLYIISVMYRNYLQSRLYHKAAASFTYDLRDPITVRCGGKNSNG